VERLELLKVLADSSRYTIYQEVVAADAPMSTAEIAGRLSLHPNTVRLHLEKMREAGLVELVVDRHGSVGRPGHRWTLAGQGPPAGPDPAGFRLLAHLLAEVAATNPVDARAVATAGRARGRERAAHRPKGRAPSGSPAACVRATVEDLAELGFDPDLDERPAPGGRIQACISFTRCPFRELAVLYPDLICQLHRGITEGIVAQTCASAVGVGAEIDTFSSLVDPDPCRVEVSFHPTGN
jgi:predicted ArsR family transcriptional regulator